MVNYLEHWIVMSGATIEFSSAKGPLLSWGRYIHRGRYCTEHTLIITTYHTGTYKKFIAFSIFWWAHFQCLPFAFYFYNSFWVHPWRPLCWLSFHKDVRAKKSLSHRPAPSSAALLKPRAKLPVTWPATSLVSGFLTTIAQSLWRLLSSLSHIKTSPIRRTVQYIWWPFTKLFLSLANSTKAIFVSWYHHIRLVQAIIVKRT